MLNQYNKKLIEELLQNLMMMRKLF